MRRKDREQSEEFGWNVLETCPYAVLSTTDDEGLPYGIPVSPAVLDGVIYFHSAKHGMKSKLLREHSDVCLVGVRDVVPLPEAYSTEYASAVVHGTVAEVTDDAERIAALRASPSATPPRTSDISRPPWLRSFHARSCGRSPRPR